MVLLFDMSKWPCMIYMHCHIRVFSTSSYILPHFVSLPVLSFALNNHDSSYCEKVGNYFCLWLLAADQEQLTPDKENNPSLYSGKNHEAFVNAFWYVIYAYNTYNAYCWQSVEERADLN